MIEMNFFDLTLRKKSKKEAMMYYELSGHVRNPNWTRALELSL